MTAVTIHSPLQIVLVAGISGSARLHEKLGKSEAVRAVDRCIKRIERTIDAWKGNILRVDSNKIMATFDAADAAIQAAIEMQQRIADLPPVSGVKIGIRVGISADCNPTEDGAPPREIADEADRLADLAKPTQILASETFGQLVSPSLSAHITNTDHQASNGTETAKPALEIIAPLSPAQGGEEPIDKEPNESVISLAHSSQLLTLLYRGNTIQTDIITRIIRVARDAGCDIVLQDRRASRLHATIEHRGSEIVLIDQSTNGSYVTLDRAPEVFVRRSEFVLQAEGRIAFASSSTSPEADIVEFRVT